MSESRGSIEEDAARFFAATRAERGIEPANGFLGTPFTRAEAFSIVERAGVEPWRFLRASAEILRAYEAEHGTWTPKITDDE